LNNKSKKAMTGAKNGLQIVNEDSRQWCYESRTYFCRKSLVRERSMEMVMEVSAVAADAAESEVTLGVGDGVRFPLT
jgi:hypothetical protein